jgi:hypothetical protein
MVLIPLLAAPPMVSAAAAPQPPSGGGMQVQVDPGKACFPVGEYPQLQGGVVPMEGVTRSRLFFRSSLSNEFYYVEAVSEGGKLVARLPRPRGPEVGPLIFYLEATRSDFAVGRSLEGSGIVVRKIEECPRDRKAAPVVPGGPVSVFDVAGNPAFPAGFEGITGVGAAAAAGGVGAAAGAGGFFTSTAGLITLGAIAVGVTTVVIATHGGNEPTSPSR